MKEGNRDAGMILSFEGIDASGKNTQSRMLFDYLRQNKLPCEYLSFPDYTTPVGREIRNYLAERSEFNAETRHILYAANRYELKDTIFKWKREGKLIVINRYTESNLAYGVANGLPLSWLEEIESLLPKSDLIFYLKLPPKISANRKAARDRFESNLAFLQRVSEVYDAMAAAGPGRWITISADNRRDLIYYEIVRFLGSFLKEIDITKGGLKELKPAGAFETEEENTK
jgi:dTMP kinase